MEILRFLPGWSAVFLLSVAVLILLKAPKDWSIRFLAIGLICYALAEAGHYFLLTANLLFDPPTWVGLSLAFQALALPHWLLFSQLFSRSPGEPGESGRGLSVVSYGVAVLIFALVPSTRLIAQVDPETGRAILGQVGYLYPAYSLLASVVLLSNLERTFKAADRRQRWRMKFTILAVAGIFGCMIYLNSQALLFASLNLNFLFLFSSMLILGSLMLVFSMFRGGVPEVQVYVSGRLIYRSLTIALVGAYLVSTAFITYGIRLLGGATYLFASTLFVFLALLCLAFFLLSEGVRRGLRRFVYQHFFRQQYDYREKWMEVTQKFGSKITALEIGKTLLDISEETLGVNTLSLWLRSGEKGGWYPSQVRGLSPERLQGALPDEVLLKALRDRREPLPVYEMEPGDREGRFWEGVEPRVIVPLLSDRELFGFMTLGQRTNNDPYTLEDLDLLGTIGKQAASALQTARLSEQLLAAKEVESFHLLSAFFIHDLKNFASTLSLISENSAKRFDDQEFRADALESIHRITNQIREMVAKLAAVSRPIRVEEHAVSLSSMVMGVVDEVKPFARGRLVVDVQEGLVVLADRHLLQNSVRNLLLNANEALNGNGQITLRAWRERDSVCMTVEDNGCGMSPAFLQSEIFKPFRTTKPTGAGIGLFQVKKIIEAHRGDLEVASEEGVGTTFTLRLPAMHAIEKDDEAKALDRG